KVDTRRPEVAIRTDKIVYVRVDPFIVHAAASDPMPGSGLRSFQPSVDDVPVSDGQTVDILWSALGEHTVAASAQDVAGWTQSASAKFRIVADVRSLPAIIDELRRRGEIDGDGAANSLRA